MLLSLLLGFAATPAGPSRDQAVALAIAALARDLGLAKEEIRLEEASPVEWPDASLGCPRPGEDYAKVLTPGFRVLLLAKGHRHHVHVGKNRAVVCREFTGLLGSLPKERASDALRMYATARRDLAGRKGVPEDGIRIVSLRATTWPDGRLGCPPPPSDASAPGPATRAFSSSLTSTARSSPTTPTGRASCTAPETIRLNKKPGRPGRPGDVLEKVPRESPGEPP
jgi:hypothetical protein